MHHLADIRTLIFIALHLALATFLILAFPYMASWQVALGFAAMCFSCFVMAVIVHNTIHAPMFKSRALNKLTQMVLSVAQGHPMTAFVPGHNFSHHMHTLTTKDIMRPSQINFRINLFNQLFFFFRVVPEIMDSERRWARKMRKENPAWFWQWVIENILVYTMRISLLVYSWKAAIIFVAIPHLYGHWGVVGANIYQHEGCVPNHKYNHSRTFTGWLLNWVLFNNGYHGAHHMAPTVHWTELPAWHEKNVAPYVHPSLVHKSIIAYLFRSNIWPGKRVDLEGHEQRLTREPSADWIPDTDLLDRRTFMAQLGADPVDLAKLDEEASAQGA